MRAQTALCSAHFGVNKQGQMGGEDHEPNLKKAMLKTQPTKNVLRVFKNPLFLKGPSSLKGCCMKKLWIALSMLALSPYAALAAKVFDMRVSFKHGSFIFENHADENFENCRFHLNMDDEQASFDAWDDVDIGANAVVAVSQSKFKAYTEDGKELIYNAKKWPPLVMRVACTYHGNLVAQDFRVD